MLLIGMFDSPFVRRVAVSMKLLGLSFEHANWSVGRDFDRIREYNPLGRVPTLVLPNGEKLFESAPSSITSMSSSGREVPDSRPLSPGSPATAERPLGFLRVDRKVSTRRLAPCLD